jgi:hypothetical protein
MGTARDVILRLLRADASEPEQRWLEHALPQAGHGGLTQLLAAYTAASRALGQRLLTSRPTAAAAAGDIQNLQLEHWTLEDAGRLLCLLERHATAGNDTFVSDASACYEQGDAREQASWLRGVALMPGPERFLPVVVDACRTNILTVFQAVACENPYPASFFPELNFNQLVLKAMFNGLALTRIVGLEVRANADLARMASDYADERRAAGRSVPTDLPLATVGAQAQRTNA